jgi:hypothetical protein
MTELIDALNGLTWPGALALAVIAIAVAWCLVELNK